MVLNGEGQSVFMTTVDNEQLCVRQLYRIPLGKCGDGADLVMSRNRKAER
jgi:hypothetical protein